MPTLHEFTKKPIVPTTDYATYVQPSMGGGTGAVKQGRADILTLMKFGRIKRQHGRVARLDTILDRIVRDCPFVSRIVPGRIKVRKGKTPPVFSIQYPTPAGLKCQFASGGAVQEVFLICSDTEKTIEWLGQNPPT